MPGTPLNLNYPVIGEPIQTALGKLITLLQSIQADIEPKITAAELNWNADLSAAGHSLLNVGVLSYTLGIVTSTAVGSTFCDGNGDFYVVTAAGAVQVTSGGKINSSGIGGIAGDYGGSNPARVTFNDTSNQYRFTADTFTTWADLVCNDVYLESAAGGSMRLTADDTIASALVYTLKAPPGSGTSVLTLDSAGNVAPGAAVSNAQSFTGAVTMTGGLTVNTTALSVGANVSLTGTADLKHAAQWELPQQIGDVGFSVGGAFSKTANPNLVVPPAGIGQALWLGISGLRVGDVIQKVTVKWRSSAAGNTQFEVDTQDGGAAPVRVSDNVTVAFGDALFHTTTITFTTPYTVASGDVLYLKWTPPASTNSDRLEKFSVYVTH